MRGFLLDMGVWGQDSLTKVIPAAVERWDNMSVAALLSGLFATDGCVHVTAAGRVCVSYSSSSLDLIMAIRRLLSTRFGIYASAPCPNVKKRKNGTGYEPNYTIAINSWDNVNRLAAVITPPGVKQRLLQYALPAWPQPKHAAEAGRCAFVSQTDIGTCETFDIEVEHPDHLFVLANGLIVSNSEKLTQSSLASKHSGGIAGAGPTGFELINQLAQVPAHFPGGAAHAQEDGVVKQIRPAPQGGHYVSINNTEHYVDPEHTSLVKPGDPVEAGDVLSTGLPNPAEIVKHKGIGEGRRYFMHAFRNAYRASGMSVDRRNVELITRGMIDHVRLNDMWGDYAPDDVVQYHTLERNWTPRPGTAMLSPSASVGRYLEAPVLHYTIGTKVRPSMLPHLAKFDVKSLQVHNDPPPFEPEMQRAATSISTDPDPFTRMLGSGQKGNLLDAVHRGDISDTEGTSYVPSLIAGKPFARSGPTKGWDPTKE